MGLTKWIRKFGKSRRLDCLESICSQEAFHTLLDFERDRSHRTGDRFSLVVFDSARGAEGADYACPLIELLVGRIRSIDRVGWADKRSIGALLPDTAPAGARKLADDICEKMLEKGFVVHSSVYAFPSEWLVELKGSQGGRGTGDHPVHHIYSQPSQTEKNQTAVHMISAPHVGQRRLPRWKRAIDFGGAFLGLIVLSPLFLLVGLFIKRVSPGPVFFRQERIGYDGEPFIFMKFRSMHVNRSEDVHREYLVGLINGAADGEDAGPAMTKLQNDPRIIPFGNFLRKTCLDELPQLINVLRGEMSLVGPRPPIPYEVAEYLRWHNGRFDAVPGMTGLWQVSGKNRLSFKEMIRLDIRYAREVSFWLDMKILAKTPMAILGIASDSRKHQGLSTKGA